MRSVKGVLLVLSVLMPLSASAVLIDTSIGSYDVSDEFIFGGAALLPEGHPWLVNEPLANEFAAQLGGALGFPNTAGNIFCDPLCGDVGPYFAIAAGGPSGFHTLGAVATSQDGRVLLFFTDQFV